MAAALAASAALSACKWTEFDDLGDEAWVGSTGKSGVDSSDYGTAVQRGASGKLIVTGAAQPTISQLVYDGAGASSKSATIVELNSQYGVAQIEPQPMLIADDSTAGKASGNVALAFGGGGGQVVVLTGVDQQYAQHNVNGTGATADAATFMQAPPRSDPGHVGEAQPIQVLVASGELVFGAYNMATPIPQPKCKLTDGGTAILPRALGAVSNGTTDDVLAWSAATGKLYKYPSAVFHGCATMQEPVGASFNAGFKPDRSSQILALGGGKFLLLGRHDADEASYLQVVDAATMTAVGSSVTTAGARQAVIFDGGTTQYAVVGYPTATVDGTAAGQVLLYRIAASGLEANPAATLHDAQPEDRQLFGRSVAVMSFNSKPVIVVAANNEVFAYFRAKLGDGNDLYAETRSGR